MHCNAKIYIFQHLALFIFYMFFCHVMNNFLKIKVSYLILSYLMLSYVILSYLILSYFMFLNVGAMHCIDYINRPITTKVDSIYLG